MKISIKQVSSVYGRHRQSEFSLTKGLRSKRQLRYLLTVEIWPLSSCLKPNFRILNIDLPATMNGNPPRKERSYHSYF